MAAADKIWMEWWEGLSDGWKNVFRHTLDFTEPGRDGTRKLSSIKELYVHDEELGRDLTPLARLKSLTNLNLQAVPISSLEPISTLTNLVHLDLSETGITSVAPLKNLKKLKNLYLGNNSELIDISPIIRLESIRILDISETGIEDIRPFKRMKSLSRLIISQSSEFAEDLEHWSDALGCSVVTQS
jgi:Leucine-rich repeat (LRR) protein